MRNKIILTDRDFLNIQLYKKIYVFNHLTLNYEKMLYIYQSILIKTLKNIRKNILNFMMKLFLK